MNNQLIEENYKLATLKNTQNAIEYVKSQQWIVTNYGLLLYGAIIGYLKLIEFPKQQISCPEKSIIFLISLTIYILCIVTLCILYSSWGRYRELVNNIEKTYENTKFYQDVIKPHKIKSMSTGHELILGSLCFILTIGLLAIYRFLFCN